MAAPASLGELEAGARTAATAPRDLLLAGAVPVAFRHYPDGDLYDRVSRAQAYFHVHAQGERGHIHLFLRPGALPAGLRRRAGPVDAPTHLGALELGEDGWPSALFATNRWVTGEAWYHAADLVPLLPAFTLALAEPWRWLGQWLTTLVATHRQGFAALLRQRDAAMAGAGPADFEDRRREVLVRDAHPSKPPPSRGDGGGTFGNQPRAPITPSASPGRPRLPSGRRGS